MYIKFLGLFKWMFLGYFSLQMSLAYAGVRENNPSQMIQDLGVLLLAFPVFLGTLTGMIIKTEVDNTFTNPRLSKFLIGIGFGVCATVGLAHKYPSLSIYGLFFPSYCLAALGTPVMVYSAAIVSDAQMWQTVGKGIAGGIKRFFKLEK